MPPAPYNAILLVSFGGPERREDVLPFLENVLRGGWLGPRTDIANPCGLLERVSRNGQHAP